MTWHNVALAALGVGAGITGAILPAAAPFTTPAAWTLIGGALGLAVPGMMPALAKVIAASPKAQTEPPKS